MREAARAAGVCCGLTADCQLVTPADDPFAWGRFGAEEFYNLLGKPFSLTPDASCFFMSRQHDMTRT